MEYAREQLTPERVEERIKEAREEIECWWADIQGDTCPKWEREQLANDCWNMGMYWDEESATCVDWSTYETLKQERCEANYPDGIWGDSECCYNDYENNMTWDWTTEVCMT